MRLAECRSRRSMSDHGDRFACLHPRVHTADSLVTPAVCLILVLAAVALQLAAILRAVFLPVPRFAKSHAESTAGAAAGYRRDAAAAMCRHPTGGATGRNRYRFNPMNNEIVTSRQSTARAMYKMHNNIPARISLALQLTALFLAGTVGCEPPGHRASRTVAAPLEGSAWVYKTCLSEMTHFLDEEGPVRLVVNWNPKAPKEMQAKYEYQVMLLPDKRIVALHQAPSIDCAVWFSEDHIRIVDNIARTRMDLDGIDFESVGAKTGTLAEIYAARLLLGCAAYPSLRKQLGGAIAISLDPKETDRVMRRIYVDEWQDGAAAGKTEIARVGDVGSRELELRDHAGVIFAVSAADSDRAAFADRIRSVEWAEAVRLRQRPPLDEVLLYLKGHSVQIPADARPVLLTSDVPEVLEGRPAGQRRLSEGCHVEYRGKRLFLMVGDSFGTPGRPVRIVSRKNDVIFSKHFDDHEHVLGAAVNLEGQDWSIGYVIPGGPDSADIEKSFTPVIAAFLEDELREGEKQSP